MCCFEHTYSGVLENEDNRRYALIYALVCEILDKLFLASVAAVEFSQVYARSTIKQYLLPRACTILTLSGLYLILGILHCLIFKHFRMLRLQIVFTAIMKTVLVLLLVSILSMTTVEGWNSTGLTTFVLISAVLIKIGDLVIASFKLVDMNSDWSNLVEFGFGSALVASTVMIQLFLTTDMLVSTIIAGSILGTLLSLISLLDLQQNMSINSWWWEEKMFEGSMYHVIRQCSLLWCVRIEQRPNALRILPHTIQNQAEDVMVTKLE